MRSLLIASLLAACRTTDPDPLPLPDTDLSALACGDAEAVIQVTTEDGETLFADYQPPEAADAGVVVLLHMAPTAGNHRGDWPLPVRRALAETGIGVLNLDRRGSGDSTGDPDEAATGEGGRLDVEAVVSALLASSTACAIDPERVQLIGASNGSTAAFDYTVAHDPGLPDLDSMVFLSPGTYTENQHSFDGGWNLSFPILWLYPFNEPYADGFVADAPGAWQFVQTGSSHGTHMFDDDDQRVEVTDELARFVSETVAR